jgi:hypothetical protein
MSVVEWNVYDVNHKVKKIQAMAHFVLDATICLSSLHAFFSEGNGLEHLHGNTDQASLKLDYRDIFMF